MRAHVFRSPIGLTDAEGRLFGVFVGPPAGDSTWAQVTAGVRVAMQHAKQRLRFKKKLDRRGRFKTIAVGLSYGGGQTVGVDTLFETIQALTMPRCPDFSHIQSAIRKSCKSCCRIRT